MKLSLLSFILVLLAGNGIGQSNYVDSLERIVAKGKQDMETGQAQNLLATKYGRTDLIKAKNYAHGALYTGQTIQHSLTISAAYAHLVSLHMITGNIDSSLYYLNQLKALAETDKSPKEKTVKGNYYSTAGLFYKKSGNMKAALPNFIQAIKYTEAYGNKLATAGQSLNVANTYLDLGNYKDALNYYFKALQLFETLEHREGQSFCLQGIGNSFCELEQYDRALQYVNQSLALKKALGDKRGVSTAYMGLGEIFSGLKQYDKALNHFLSALKMAKELKLVTEERTLLYNIGRTYSAKNDPGTAERYLKQSKLLAEKLDDQSAVSAADMELIALQNKLKKAASEEKLIESVNTLNDMGDAYKTLAGYQHLARFYEEGEQFDKALNVKEKYYALRDSIQGNELKLMLRNMEEQYNAKKREKEIAILKKDQLLASAKLKQQRSVQYATITFFILAFIIGGLMWNRYKVVAKAKRQVELEKMRNNIAKDLHDDIGSTLSSINIMSKVMLESSTDNKQGLEKIKEHSGNIMESMGDIVWAINPTNDTFEKLVYRMKEFAAEILEPLNIQYKFEFTGPVSNVKLDPEKRKDLFLIFKETINNAAKYSGCKSILINLGFNGKELELKIKDNGNGFIESRAREGNGIRNIRERAQNLAAVLDYNTSPGEGTSVLLTVPVT